MINPMPGAFQNAFQMMQARDGMAGGIQNVTHRRRALTRARAAMLSSLSDESLRRSAALGSRRAAEELEYRKGPTHEELAWGAGAPYTPYTLPVPTMPEETQDAPWLLARSPWWVTQHPAYQAEKARNDRIAHVQDAAGFPTVTAQGAGGGKVVPVEGAGSPTVTAQGAGGGKVVPKVVPVEGAGAPVPIQAGMDAIKASATEARRALPAVPPARMQPAAPNPNVTQVQPAVPAQRTFRHPAPPNPPADRPWLAEDPKMPPEPKPGFMQSPEHWREMLDFSLALMAAGEPQPGAQRGPTFAGAVGQAGRATTAAADARADKDYARKAATAKAKAEESRFARTEKRLAAEHVAEMGAKSEGHRLQSLQITTSGEIKKLLYGIQESRAQEIAAHNDVMESLSATRNQIAAVSQLAEIAADIDERIAEWMYDNQGIATDAEVAAKLEEFEAEKEALSAPLRRQAKVKAPKKPATEKIVKARIDALKAKYPDRTEKEIIDALVATGRYRQ